MTQRRLNLRTFLSVINNLQKRQRRRFRLGPNGFRLGPNGFRLGSNGFTLVEMMVVGAIGLILIIAVFLLFRKGLAGIGRGSQKLNHLHEASRILAMLREDLRLCHEEIDENDGTFSFKKWAVKKEGSSGAVTKLHTTVTYELKDMEDSSNRGKKLLRKETVGTGLPTGTPRSYGRGLLKELLLEPVEENDRTFVRIKLVMTTPEKGAAAEETGGPDEEDAGEGETSTASGAKSLVVNTIVLPVEQEGFEARKHWISNP